VTLSIGIVFSLFTGIWVSRLIQMTLIQTGFLKQLRMLELFKVPNFPFIKYGKACITVSALISVIGCGFYFLRSPNDNYDLDFAGGALVRINLNKEIETSEVTRRLEGKYPGLSVLTIGTGGEIHPGRSTQFEIQVSLTEESDVTRFRSVIETAFLNDLAPNG